MEGARILVCDDDRAVRTALNVNLSKASYQVTLVDSAEKAVEVLQATPHDVLLTDVKLPDGEGLELDRVLFLGRSDRGRTGRGRGGLREEAKVGGESERRNECDAGDEQ